MANTLETPPSQDEQVVEAVRRARDAQAHARGFTQREVDDVVRAVGWACYEEGHARALAECSVRETHIGNETDRVNKVRRKALMMMRDLDGAPSVGVVFSDPETGITRIAKPVGVVAALCPSTHPATDLMAKAMMVLKGRNAMIASPSPSAVETSELTCELIRDELSRLGAPSDLLQVLRRPSKASAAELMQSCDMVAVTGSARNVRSAYSSGTPAVAGGAGNVPILIDSSADCAKVAADISLSKTFDYGTACSSESELLIHSSVYDDMLAQLVKHGGVLLSLSEKQKLAEAIWPGGKINPQLVGRSAATIAAAAGISLERDHAKTFFIVEEDEVGAGVPFSGEKLSVSLAVYRYDTDEEAGARIKQILAHMGAGHSFGIHTANIEAAHQLGEAVDVARVIVNQPQGPAEAGSFTNGLPATMILGCGTWGGNNVSGNVTYQHFLNFTTIAEPLPEKVPSEEELWGDYLRTHHSARPMEKLEGSSNGE